MFRVPSGTAMTPELLGKFMGKHKMEVTGRYRKLRDAYQNDYAIKFARKKPAWKPDNRIPVNFAKYITDTMNGFFLGIPVRVTSDDEAVSEYINFLSQYNVQDDGDAELSKICSIYGHGFEMYYNDENGNIGIVHLSPMEAFFIYDDSILERPMFFVRHYKDADNVEWGSWSDGKVVQHFVERGSYVWVDEPKPHGFDGVPASEFVENAERMGVFESVLPLIDAYNKAISEKANDVDYFADAYLKVLGAYLGEEEVKHIRDDRVINFDGDTEKLVVEFLQKPDGDTTQEHLIDRLERLIFQISMVADISDENFGTASGIALKYKLQAMSNLAKAKERKFKEGMQRRYKLIFSNPISQVRGVPKDAWTGIRYKFTQNIPANVLEETQIAGNLEGIVSKQTQLETLSVVENVQAEIERMEEEEQAAGEDAVTRRMFRTAAEDGGQEGVTDGQ